jgi:hypothetical protein
MNAQDQIAAAKIDGKQACADYVKEYGFADARSYLNQQQPVGQRIEQSLSMYGYWAGWADELLKHVR